MLFSWWAFKSQGSFSLNTGKMSWKLCHNPQISEISMHRGVHLTTLKREDNHEWFFFSKTLKTVAALLYFLWSLCRSWWAVLIIRRRQTSLGSKWSRFRQARMWVVTNIGIWFCKTEVYPVLALDLSISVNSLYSEPCWKMYYIWTVALRELWSNGSRNNHLWDYYSLSFAYVRSDVSFAQLWMRT